MPRMLLYKLFQSIYLKDIMTCLCLEPFHAYLVTTCGVDSDFVFLAKQQNLTFIEIQTHWLDTSNLQYKPISE